MVDIGLIKKEFRSYNVRRLIEEGRKLRQNIIKIRPSSLCFYVDKDFSYSIHRYNKNLDVILPRFGDQYWDFSMLALEHFEKMRIPIVNSSFTERVCKNKYLTSLVLKQKRVPQPAAALALTERDLLYHIKKMSKPLVLKLLDRSEGRGVSRINDDTEAEDWLETMEELNLPIYIQEYIPHPGEDFRVFLIDNKVIAAMRRKAKAGWKSNVSLGAAAYPYKPSKEIEEIAISASKAVKADVCGVDLMIHDEQARVIEVNHSPYFEGLEKATGKNIAREIVKFAVKKARK